jgi:hypothetical protein
MDSPAFEYRVNWATFTNRFGRDRWNGGAWMITAKKTYFTNKGEAEAFLNRKREAAKELELEVQLQAYMDEIKLKP